MPTILVVDDDASVLRLLEMTLADLGEVVAVGTGEDALDVVADMVPDIVVLDVVLPGLSGLEVLEQWRSEPRTADLEIVLLSGRDAPSDQAAGYNAGADAYVTKPVDIDVLEALIAAMLANRSEQQQHALDEIRGIQAGDFPG